MCVCVCVIVCVCVYKIVGKVCICRKGGVRRFVAEVLSVYCLGMSVIVYVCDVHLPLVVSSAHGEHSGLSVPTLLHNTSETHILSDRERQKKIRKRGEGR